MSLSKLVLINFLEFPCWSIIISSIHSIVYSMFHDTKHIHCIINLQCRKVKVDRSRKVPELISLNMPENQLPQPKEVE